MVAQCGGMVAQWHGMVARLSTGTGQHGRAGHTGRATGTGPMGVAVPACHGSELTSSQAGVVAWGGGMVGWRHDGVLTWGQVLHDGASEWGCVVVDHGVWIMVCGCECASAWW